MRGLLGGNLNGAPLRQQACSEASQLRRRRIPRSCNVRIYVRLGLSRRLFAQLLAPLFGCGTCQSPRDLALGRHRRSYLVAGVHRHYLCLGRRSGGNTLWPDLFVGTRRLAGVEQRVFGRLFNPCRTNQLLALSPRKPIQQPTASTTASKTAVAVNVVPHMLCSRWLT